MMAVHTFCCNPYNSLLYLAALPYPRKTPRALMSFFFELRRPFFVAFVALICTLLANAQPAQQWTWTYDTSSNLNQETWGFTVDAAGNSYVVGDDADQGNIGGGPDALIVKLDPSGVPVWIDRLPDSLDLANYYGVAVDSSGNVFATGYMGSTNSCITAKYSSAGVRLWVSSMPSLGGVDDFPQGTYVFPDSSGGVSTFGYAFNQGNSIDHWVFLKYAADGSTASGGEVFQGGYSVAATANSSGQIFGTGYGRNASNNLSLFTARFDPTTGPLWGVAGTQNTRGASIAADGLANSYVIDDRGMVTKFDPAGNASTLFTLPANGGARVIALDSKGNIVLGGKSTVSDGNGGLFDEATVWKYSPAGALLWSKTWNPSTSTFGTSGGPYYRLIIDPSDNVLFMSGLGTNSVTGAEVMKFNADGVSMWPSSGGIFTNGAAVFPNLFALNFGVDGSGNILVGGLNVNPIQTLSATRMMVVKMSDNFISALSISPSTAPSGSNGTGTVTLQGPAPTGGVLVHLSSVGTATVPATMTVPAGQSSGTFAVTAHNATYAPSLSTVTATAAGSSKQSAFTSNPGDYASFLSQTVPTAMAASIHYTVTLQFKNTGSTTWDSAHSFKVHSMSPVNNTTWGSTVSLYQTGLSCLEAPAASLSPFRLRRQPALTISNGK